MSNSVIAQSVTDYKALVCVYMLGGNDSNNMIIPYAANQYNQYAAIRGPGGLAISYGDLLPLMDQNGSANYSFHPSMSGLQGLWQQGKVAALFNAGTLVQPITKSTFAWGAANVPPNLQSHSDQQNQMQNALSNRLTASGWGGRIADRLNGSAGGAAPVGISAAGNSLFLTGDITGSVQVPVNGTLDVSNSDAASYNALKQLVALQPNTLMMSTIGQIQSDALSLRDSLNPILASTSSTSACFQGLTSDFAQQLQILAKIIENRVSLGSPGREIFYVAGGSFDTHFGQMSTHAYELYNVSSALTAFYNATAQIGVADKVTSFTLSDFTRTLVPNAAAGTDHAWGGHQLIVGGAVNGNSTYGTFPQLVLDGPDDLWRGTWVPTTSIEQYGATLATWFGLNATDLDVVFPNLQNFGLHNLGFMKT